MRSTEYRTQAYLFSPAGAERRATASAARLTPKQKADLAAWHKAHRWHPHQLRHTAATEIRRAFGLEAAQLALGHSSTQVTEAVYAEREHGKAAEIMRQVGLICCTALFR